LTSFSHLTVGDTWTLLVTAEGTAPKGASIVLSSSAPDSSPIKQLTLAAPYSGSGDPAVFEAEDAYMVAQHFTVRDPAIEVQTITVKVTNTATDPWATVSPQQYEVRWKTVHLGCVAWNADDFTLEAVLHTAASGALSGVTVSRSTDATNAPNGYVYSIYFPATGAPGGIGGSDAPNPDALLGLDVNGAGCAIDFAGTQSVAADVAIEGSPTGGVFTTFNLPLGAADDSSAVGRYLRGTGTEQLALYTVSGHLFTVEFDTNLGDVPPLAGITTGLKGTNRAITAFDAIVSGELPDAYVAGDMWTGVPYSVRAAAYTDLGYGQHSAATAVAKPAAAPPQLAGVRVEVALHVDEVQTLTLGATHRDEVQAVVSSAPHFVEVQLLTVARAPLSLVPVSGDFALYFAEHQTITLTASGPMAPNAAFVLKYTTYAPAGDDVHATVVSTSTAACIPFDATAAEVKSALEALSNVDTVDVVRSCDGSNACAYGYTWDVAFVGSKVRGNVAQLTWANCAAAPMVTANGAVAALVTIATANEGEAYGTTTHQWSVKLDSKRELATGVGQIQLSVTYGGTAALPAECLPWDATAEEVETALELLPNVDSVRVEVGGDSFVRTWTVLFDGNAMHDVHAAPAAAPVMDARAGMVLGPCTPLTTVVDHVSYVLNPVVHDYTLKAEEIGSKGLPIPSTADRDEMAEQLSYLPAVVPEVLVYTSDADEHDGLTWYLSFSNNDGDVPPLICLPEATFVGDCSVTTLINGNTIGGHFYLGDSAEIPWNATSDQMAAAVQGAGMGAVTVTRSDADARGGYTWSVTFTELPGDVPPMTAYNKLTGYNADVRVEQVVQGNALGGTYTLALHMEETEPIAFDADAADVEAALEALDAVGDIVVTRGAASPEGGSVYTITFINADVNVGDVEALVADVTALTGAGRALLVSEAVKGSEGVGSAVKLSFQAPLNCAQSQVADGRCGDAVDRYRVEWDTAAAFSSVPRRSTELAPAALLTQVQRVRTSYATSGTFQLAYGDATTAPLNAAASAFEVRVALEGLDGISTVSVARDYSYEERGAVLLVTKGHDHATCVTVGTCDYLAACDLVRLDGVAYRVSAGHVSAVGVTTVLLSSIADCAVGVVYGGDIAQPTAYAAQTWARGYEWSVTFLAIDSGAAPLALTSPPHKFAGSAAAVSISGLDCVGCYYVGAPPDLPLTLGRTYYLHVMAHNAIGYSDAAGAPVVSIVPNQVPMKPSIDAEVMSGTKVAVHFSPPAQSAGDIWGYRVQWDTAVTFANAVAPGDDDCTMAPGTDAGSCVATAGLIVGDKPFTQVVKGLSHKQYYFRVSALGAVAAQAVDPDHDPPDNTNWSDTVSATPTNKPPTSPGDVVVYVLDGATLQVHVEVPTETGGATITNFVFETDTSSTFSAPVPVTVPVANLPELYEGGPLVYHIGGLQAGVPYYVRAYAQSSIGNSATSVAVNNPAVPSQLAPAPADAVAAYVDVPTTQLHTAATVVWSPPPDTGGAAVSGYRVEWWQATAVTHEVQVVSVKWPPTYNVAGSADTLMLQFDGAAVYQQFGVGLSEVDFRDGLMNMGIKGDISSGGVDFLPVGHIVVNRTNINIDEGYAYRVMFMDEQLNPGDQPEIVATSSTSFIAHGSEAVVKQVVSGVRAGGNPEVQLIAVDGTSAPQGFWRAQFGNSTFSTYLWADATGVQVEAALQGLYTLGDLSVTRVNPDPLEVGYKWLVTFITPVGDRGALVVDGAFLWNAEGDATITVSDGNNAVYPSDYKPASSVSKLLCPQCVIGETPVGYRSVDLTADKLSYTVTGLTPGAEYTIAISAINAHGQGIRAIAATNAPLNYLTPPVTVPGPPTSVSVATKGWAVNEGDGLGDGQRLIVTYSPPLADGGTAVTAYKVELDPTPTFDNPIAEEFRCPSWPDYSTWVVEVKPTGGSTGGYFYLKLVHGGTALTTDPIPYNAVAQAEDEVVRRLDLKTALLTCTLNGNTCPAGVRFEQSGSMQMKLNMLASLDDGVLVSRQDVNGGYRWTVTFLDPGDDFVLSVADATHMSGYLVTATKVLDGHVYNKCVGAMVVPTTGGLVAGEAYYARVTAYNRIGYGSVWTAPGTARPMTVPGLPTTVTLDKNDATSLKVVFSPPSNDGGGVIIRYVIELATNAGFTTNWQEVPYIPPATGAPFHKVLTGLENGTAYYVRVRACNSLGCGPPQTSSPSFQHPYMAPSAPTGVRLAVTSDSMLTVSFAPPTTDGGDAVTSYIITWDVSAYFNSLTGTPHQGSTTVQGAGAGSVTLTYLSSGSRYYAKVAAVNGASAGVARISSPDSAYPSKQRPGKPVGVALASTSAQTINVAWQFPLIPWHGIPCSGTAAAPVQCPTAPGGTVASDGGDAITHYEVQWSLLSSFNVLYASGPLDATSRSYTITQLTSGLKYYVRVVAANTVGYGAFCEFGGNTCDTAAGTRLSKTVT
ncbi:hypothetical protein JKP88DRAFT_308703, partial [Tribonema minus]